MFQRQPKAIIFDMDGVIIDSEPTHILAERITCKSHGIIVPEDFWLSCRGKMARAIFTEAVERFGIVEKVEIDDLVDYKRTLFASICESQLQAVPGALRFISFIRTFFGKVAVATSSDRKTQQELFKQFRLNNYFDSITTGDDVRKIKPDPEAYITAAYRLGVDPKDCLVIEDTDIGITSARAAGCTAIGITTSFKPYELFAAGANGVIRSYDELAKVLIDNTAINIPLVLA